MEAHKVVLAASSPFFEELLKKNKHIHPLIYLRGINFEDLLGILDFLYYGEASIPQDKLDNFLKIAAELEIKSLDGGNDTKVKEENFTLTSKQSVETKLLSQREPKEHVVSHSENTKTDNIIPKKLIDFVKQEKLGKVRDLEEKVKSMMFLGEKKILMGGKMKSLSFCKVCGKEAQHSAIRDHIEANHLEGISIPCNLCKKSLKSRKTLIKHNLIFHKYLSI